MDCHAHAQTGAQADLARPVYLLSRVRRSGHDLYVFQAQLTAKTGFKRMHA